MFVAVAEGDVLLVDGDCVAVWEAGALVDVCIPPLPVAVPLGDPVPPALLVGLPDLVAEGACVPDTRLVLGTVLPAEVAGREAVVGCAAGEGDWVAEWTDWPVVVEFGVLPADSSTAMIAMIPHAAMPPPASHRVRRRLRP